MDNGPFISKRKTDKKPTYTHKTSVKNRTELLNAFTVMGVDMNVAESFGTVEQMILGEELYRDGAVEIQYVSEIPESLLMQYPYEIAIFGYVDSKSRKERKYPFTITLQLQSQDQKEVVYTVPRTIDLVHECEFTAIEKTKKWVKFPCCKHRIAPMCWVDDILPKTLQDTGREHVKISSFYNDQNLLPVDEDVKEYYSTIKHLKSVERKVKLYEYFTSPEKVFRSNDW
ncbi:MAG: hypothetical protein GOV02_01780 [Candidatus Aenigmarchaeota archaeon]|nr:hypothetical protein [Candidatus Aenigmarchaeota archaeon]